MSDQRLASFLLLIGVLALAYWLWRHAKKPPGIKASGGSGGETAERVPPVLPRVPGTPHTPGEFIPWPPEVRQEWSLPPDVQQRHHEAMERFYTQRGSVDLTTPDGGNLV